MYIKSARFQLKNWDAQARLATFPARLSSGNFSSNSSLLSSSTELHFDWLITLASFRVETRCSWIKLSSKSIICWNMFGSILKSRILVTPILVVTVNAALHFGINFAKMFFLIMYIVSFSWWKVNQTYITTRYIIHSLLFKVENILKGSLDSIPSPTPSVEIQIMVGKVFLKCKVKTLLGVVNKLLITKGCWHHPAMFYLK